MSAMVEALTSQLLSGGNLGALSGQLGAEEQQTRSAVNAALPMLLAGLAKNASQPDGAQALFGALEKKHDGGMLDDLAGFLGKSDTADGEGILGHVFGNRRSTVEQGVGKAAGGMDPAKVARMMSMLAPMVMGYLGRQKRQKNLDARSLGDLLGGEAGLMEQKSPGFGMLGKLLDKDGDGSIADDLLGKLFGKN
jgi:hypothetical protein